MGVKVLVIDDSEDLCRLIEYHLSSDFDLTYAYNGTDAFKHLSKDTFDVILVDLVLPDISGFEICSAIRSEDHSSKDAFVIVMSARTDIKAKVTAYNLGALNYLEKPLNSEILKALMYSLDRHKSQVFDVRQAVGNIELNIVRQSIAIEGKEEKLTGSEMKILSFLAERAGSTIARDKILAVITREDKSVSERLVDTHISSLRKKIKTSNVTIDAVYKEGYQLTVH